MSLVSFVKIKDDDFKTAILNALGLINFEFGDDTRKIVIKPNMCYYWNYSTGQTTDPRFIGALIDVLRGDLTSDVDISVVESDASAMKCKHVFKFLGYEKLAEKYDIKLVNLSEDKSDPVEVTVRGQSYRIRVPRTIQDANLKINVTKIKYSLEKIKITCALKNIFGCNPYQKKFIYHSELNEAIVAINKAMKFDLCLVDGNIVAGSQPCKLGLVMASQDSVAIDASAAKIAGVKLDTIGYIRLAQKEGLGNTRYVSVGAPIDYFMGRYPSKNAQKKLMSKAFNVVSMLNLGGRLGLE